MSDQNRKATLSTYAGAGATVMFTALVLAGASAPSSQAISLSAGRDAGVDLSETLLWEANKAPLMTADDSAYESSNANPVGAILKTRRSIGDGAGYQFGNAKASASQNHKFSRYPNVNTSTEKTFALLVAPETALGNADTARAEFVQTLRSGGTFGQASTSRSARSGRSADFGLMAPSFASSSASSGRGGLTAVVQNGNPTAAAISADAFQGAESKSPATSNSVSTMSADTVDLRPAVQQAAATIGPDTTTIRQLSVEAVTEPGSMALLLVGLLLVGIRGQALRSR